MFLGIQLRLLATPQKLAQKVIREDLCGESLQQFLLKTLSKDCSFRAVTAEQYRWELVRDAFINGLASAAVRQRLLERDDLSLEAALEQAYSLERAQQQSSSYLINVAASNVVLQRQRSADSIAGADIGSAYDPVSDPPPHGLAAAVKNKRCYFCGRPYQKKKYSSVKAPHSRLKQYHSTRRRYCGHVCIVEALH